VYLKLVEWRLLVAIPCNKDKITIFFVSNWLRFSDKELNNGRELIKKEKNIHNKKSRKACVCEFR
jgi:hypothetical protein